MKTIYLLMLLGSIQAKLCAQHDVRVQVSKTHSTFELPPNSIHRRFMIDLGKGNKMQVELDNWNDIDHFLNIDSMLRVFLHDIEPLKDSLADELSTKRIDYVFDSSGRKKIRVLQIPPEGSSFVIEKGDLAALKLEQDTVNFYGSARFLLHYLLESWQWKDRPYRLSLIINNLKELASLVGTLNDKILRLKQNINSRLVYDKTGVMHMKDDYEVTVKQPKGYIGGTGDYLTSDNSAAIQNYKNYFVPSFSLGLDLFIHGPKSQFQLGLAWEPNFFFQKDAQGKLQTYRNDFLTLNFGHSSILDGGPDRLKQHMALFSLSYLIYRQGDYFEKNTWRLGIGQISLFKGVTSLGPVMYFNNFFRGVTPGIRLIQRF